MSIEQHKQHTNKKIRCNVITISDSRTKDTDKSGKLMMDYLEKQGHIVNSYKIIMDEQEVIGNSIEESCANKNVDIILTNGGTGIAARDVTIETIKPLLDKEIVGFGELFRMLSYSEDIGSAAILSRAIAGVKNNKAIFSTPGSSGAVKLAMEKLILPELEHVVNELQKEK